MDMITNPLTGKRVVVMGLGRFGGGEDSTLFAVKSGAAKVLVTDQARPDQLSKALKQLEGLAVKYRLGEHRMEDFIDADVIIVNPAVPPDNLFLTAAKQAGAILTSQVELFFQLCPAPIVGITGSNGKSTTTSLIYHLLSAGQEQKQTISYRKDWLSGNIGDRPFLGMLEQIQHQDIVVLELSSFQLEQLSRTGFAPYVSVITNLTPNHLDRHGTFEAYCAAKELIFSNQKQEPRNPCLSIFNAEDNVTRGWYEKYKRQRGRKVVLFNPDDISPDILKAYKLIGRANRANLSAALKVADHFGIATDRIIEAVGSFQSLPDRLQLTAEINGIRWYNDSKSTTPVSTIAALEGIEEPKILIAGGYDKHIPFDELGKIIAQRVKAVVLIGQTAELIQNSIQNAGPNNVEIHRTDSMPQAVKLCRQLAIPGDVVLMSPACASWDMFENYQQRAKIFTESVLNS
jgi:UDP-N-acetylmuramoylalanine--D-glutamate ligase